MDSLFTCPVCGDILRYDDSRYFCAAGHSYDRARGGYVNLLMRQSRGDKNHGDDRAMISARTGFLDSGSYRPLLDTVARLAVGKANGHDSFCLLDAGCGEGYYTAGTADALNGLLPGAVSVYGIDISSDALRACHRRCRDARLAVASVFRLPFVSAGADVALNIFAPDSPAEFSRVLKDGGILIKVIPLEGHLYELKREIYGNVLETEVRYPDMPGFVRETDERLAYSFTLESNEMITALFNMTPYSHKTSPSDAAKLRLIEHITLSAEFGVLVYRKIG